MRGALFSAIFLLLVLMLATLVAVRAEGAVLPPSNPQRLDFYVYINGDNDLLSMEPDGRIVGQGEKTFKQWLEIARSAPSGVGVHLYFDSNDAIEGEFNGTYLRSYMGSDQGGVLVVDRTMDETDSSDPFWLQELLTSGREADSFKVFVFWGHGAGWRPVESNDFSHSEASFDYLAQAQVLGGAGVDLAIFDACEMAYVETLAAFQSQVPYLIASQFELPLEGVSYRGINTVAREFAAGGFVGRPEIARALFAQLATDTAEQQSEASLQAPLRLFDLTKFRKFEPEFAALVRALDGYARCGVDDSYCRRVLRRLRPRSPRAVSSDPFAVDLRRAISLLEHETQVNLGGIRQALHQLSGGFEGSAQFFMPDPTSARRQAYIPVASAWSLKLENWNLIRNWMIDNKELVLW